MKRRNSVTTSIKLGAALTSVTLLTLFACGGTSSDSAIVPAVTCGQTAACSKTCCVSTDTSSPPVVTRTCEASCSDAGATPPIPFTCDGPEDCAAGQACCGYVVVGVLEYVKCNATCDFTVSPHLCHAKKDCPSELPYCCPSTRWTTGVNYMECQAADNGQGCT